VVVCLRRRGVDATFDVESSDLGCSKLRVASSARHAAGLRERAHWRCHRTQSGEGEAL
jgi:hypothetical protein